MQCLINCTNSKDALITLEKPSTWEVLKKAANIRKYDSILNLCNSNEMPTGVQYHWMLSKIHNEKSSGKNFLNVRKNGR